MVFNTKFEVEKFDRMNRQFQVIHILIQELDTVLDDKLQDKDNGVNTRSIQFGLLRAKLVFQLRLLLQYIYILPKNRRRRRKEQGDGNRTKPCGGRRSSKQSIFLSSVVQKFEMKTVFVLHVLREREKMRGRNGRTRGRKAQS